MHRFAHGMAQAVAETLKRLLSEKHLYQAVEVDTAFMSAVAKQLYYEPRMSPVLPMMRGVSPAKSLEDILAQGRSVAVQGWMPHVYFGRRNPEMIQAAVPGTGSPIQFYLPTINTFCDRCGDRWPFNPVSEGSLWVPGKEQDEWFYLGYQCQQCKGLVVRFLVRREGLKLRLVGRDPIEVLPTPKVLPKGINKYYSDAQIAHHAGQTLAGLFLLRVFIEQFWRTTEVVKTLLEQDPRATGEKQGDAYQGTLPQDFKDHFPSLKDIYGKLSAAIHKADANALLFDECCSTVVEHFDARRLRKIA
jgi:hypothetical protein